ncbi:hypothetical protein PF005_g31806 [Phytophthora fragariae]|uniref:Uncharacterized protein n=1 Tax=Phytophthora fragariae TaxID=53985 RepID=A0A6A3PKJ3_9STRA|nr:hypothetical protein PF006_g31691 [Phytophthora fragariae]KAE9160050.1 hypothetical protein PF005_g31806 [Phytophthora fragariae]
MCWSMVKTAISSDRAAVCKKVSDFRGYGSASMQQMVACLALQFAIALDRPPVEGFYC